MDITSYILGRVAGSGGSNMHYVVVDQLPATGEEGYVYLVPKSTSGTNNYYDEYMYINESWEKIGDTEIDLSDYQHKMQYAVVPNATADNLGKIIQYTGTTTQNYTNGYFYECVSDGQNPATYSWENIEIQASAGDEVIIIEGTASGTTLNVGTQANKDKIKYIFDNYDNIMNMKVYLYLTNTNPKLYVPLTTIQKDWSNGFWLQGEIGNQGANYGINWGLYYSIMKFYIIAGSYVNNNINIFTQQIRDRYILCDNTSLIGKSNSTAWTPTGDYNPATKKYVDDSIANVITQYSTIPTASADTVGKIIQYIGTTDSTYTNGYFYIGTTDGTNYSWENINVQAGGSGGTPTISTDTHINDMTVGYYIIKKDVKIFVASRAKSSYQSYYLQNQDEDWTLQVGEIDNYRKPFIIYSGPGMKVIVENNGGNYKYNSVIMSGTAIIDTSTYNSSANNITIPSLKTDGFVSIYGAYVNSLQNGEIMCNNLYTYSDYTAKNNNYFISKGTLEKVITGKELDLKQLSTYDATKTQVLKNINGTLQWVTEE